MDTTTQRETAQIIQFPAALAKQGAARRDAEIAAAMPEIVYGNCWYHEDAVREAATTKI